MLSLLGLVLYVLFIFSDCNAYVQVYNHPWSSSEGLNIADLETIHIVETSSVYLDLRSCYIADTADIHFVDNLNIHLVGKDIYISEQSNEGERVQAYDDTHRFLLQLSNSFSQRYTKSQDKYIASPRSKITDEPVLPTAVRASASAHSPLWPIPSDIPTKRKENAWVSASSTATFSSKSKIHHPTLCVGIVDERHGESAYIYMHRSRVCSHPSKTKNKDIYLFRFLLRGPPVMRGSTVKKKGYASIIHKVS
jgi:hypothetical protein